MSLEETLQQFNRDMTGKIPEEKLKLMRDAIDELRSRQLAKNAKQKGDVVDNFSLTNAKGEQIALQDLLQEGPVVLSFYRGSWCPYCNFELRALQEKLPDFRSFNTSLVAISPQQPDQSLSTSEKNALEFEVLSDLHNQVARNFGIVFELNDDLKSLYRDLGIDLESYNGDNSQELPMPSTFVIDRDGTIVAAWHDEDHTRRMEPDEILKILSDRKQA